MSAAIPPRRPIVLKTSRDTLVLVAAASAMTLAIGYSVHSHPAPVEQQGPTAEQAAAGEWAGQLAELAPKQAAVPSPVEPMSSDALTVPKAAMALPAAPRLPPAKPRACEGAPCPPSTKAVAAIAVAPVRRAAASPAPIRVREAGLMERLNPIKQLPDMVTRPFASAGETIAGWVRRF